MRVQQVTWRSGEVELIMADEDGRVISIAHTMNYHLSIIAGYEKVAGRVVALWELNCLEPRSCYLCVRTLDRSVCIDTSDKGIILSVLKKILQQLKQVKNKELLPMIEMIRGYVEDVIEGMEK